MSTGWAQHVTARPAVWELQRIGAAAVPGGAGPGLQANYCIAGLSSHTLIGSLSPTTACPLSREVVPAGMLSMRCGQPPDSIASVSALFLPALSASYPVAKMTLLDGIIVFQWRAVAAKVQAALEQALLHDTVLRETLVQVHGFTVQEVTPLALPDRGTTT